MFPRLLSTVNGQQTKIIVNDIQVFMVLRVWEYRNQGTAVIQVNWNLFL